MGASRLILCGTAKLWPHISRQGLDTEDEAVDFESAMRDNKESLKLHGTDITLHRSLPAVLKRIKNEEGYHIVGIEQTNTSQSIYDFKWPQKSLIVVGHESRGIAEDVLALCDSTVEIPMYGLPFSLNVSHALAIALNAYCQQYPTG